MYYPIEKIMAKLTDTTININYEDYEITKIIVGFILLKWTIKQTNSRMKSFSKNIDITILLWLN